METTLIVMDTDAELARARGPVDRLTASDKPADLARLAAQARPTALGPARKNASNSEIDRDALPLCWKADA